jgi:hypothetical protein
MKSKVKPKQPNKLKDASDTTGKSRWWLLAAVLAGAIAGILYWGTKDASNADSSISTPAAAPVPASEEKDLLVGRWVRTDSDGGYTLEIKNASVDGKLDAGYFNPNPINVSRAEWQKKEGSLEVVVELRDVNYPGSTYTLSFSKTNDQLVGTYYQAVEGVNYDVAFARIR